MRRGAPTAWRLLQIGSGVEGKERKGGVIIAIVRRRGPSMKGQEGRSDTVRLELQEGAGQRRGTEKQGEMQKTYTPPPLRSKKKNGRPTM